MKFPWHPHPGAQAQFDEYRGYYALTGGAKAGGKTDLLIYNPRHQILVEHARFESGEITKSVGRSLLLRRTYKELKEITGRISRTFKEIDPEGTWNKTDKTFYWSCGYESIYGNMEHEEDFMDYYSLQLTHLGLDEATSFTEEQFDQLDTCVRSTDPVLQKMLAVRLGTNPIGPGLEWVRRRFFEVAKPGTPFIRKIEVPITENGITRTEIVEREQIFIPARVSDNLSIDQRGYGATLASKSPALRKALLEGDWYAIQSADSWAGLAWEPKVHVCKPFKIPDGWSKFRAGRYGNAWPGMSSFGWFAVDPQENIVCYRSLAITGVNAFEQAQMIKSIEFDAGEWDVTRDCSTLVGPLNQECWAQDGDRGPTIEETFRNVGVFWQKAAKSREQAAEQLKMRLQRRTNHPAKLTKDGKPVKLPGIRFFDTCWNAIQKPSGETMKVGPVVTIPTLPKDEKKPDIWAASGAHDLDMVAFAVMSRPIAGRETVAIDDDDAAEIRERSERTRFSNAWGPGGYW